MRILTGYLPRERQVAYGLGTLVMCLAHYIASDSDFFNPVLFLLGFIFIAYSASYRRMAAVRNTDEFVLNILLNGALFICVETIRRFIPHAGIQHAMAIVLSIPMAAVITVKVYRLLTVFKGWFGRVLFTLFIFFVFLSREPLTPVLTLFVVIAGAPYTWAGQLEEKKFNRYLILGAALLSGLMMLFGIRNTPILDNAHFNFIASGVYAVGATLFRVFVYSTIIIKLWRILKPKRIRSRLRWAFFLNFLIPFVLLLGLSGFSVVYLVGGYNAAASQRIIRQYGAEAGYQAHKLYEAFQGLGTSPPGEVPFRRVAYVRLPDGTERSFGNTSREIIRWIDNDRHRDVEFISIDTENGWEFWVAGYYRDTGGAGAVLAYQVDEVMLNRVRDTTGMELMLVKGQSFPWDKWPDAPAMYSSGITPEEQGRGLFNAGAAMFYLPSASSSIQLAATLKVYGTKRQFLKSLMLSQINTPDQELMTTGPDVDLQFGRITSDSINLESINIWNLILFMILVGMLGVLAALVVLSLSTSFLISRRINRSVKVLKDGTNALDRGDLNYRIPIVSSDELGDLAREFNQMIANIKTYTEEREAFLLQQVEKERLEQDLETARLLQRSLLPGAAIDNHPALEIAAMFRPMEEVGGDYYDYLWFQDQGIGLVIGDVSGHGMSAGLLMVMAKSCLVNQVRTSPGIYAIMTAINNMIIDTFKKKRLMTFQYAVFTPDGSRMRFASAGHQFPYLYRAKSGRLEELESISYPLGVRRELSLDVKEIELAEHDTVILFTDGLVEAVNPDNEQLGYERLREIFAKIKNCPAAQAVKVIMRDIDAFRGGAGQVDDMTLVIIRKRNHAENAAVADSRGFKPGASPPGKDASDHAR